VIAPGHALISGGSSGIGLALARRLASAGWSLSILARDRDRLAAAREDLAAGGAARRITTHAVDVTDAAAVERAVGAAVATLGVPALVVAAAGAVVPGRFDDLALADFRRCMDVNYLGALHLARAALPPMRRERRGRIVMIASGAALIGLYGYTAYAPAKFAVRGLAEALRSELAPDGIGVSVVYPPDTDTLQLREEVQRRPGPTSAAAAAARVRTPEVVAEAILRGIRRNRFAITAGWEMSVLAALHSVLGPALHRFWLDPVIARALRRETAPVPPPLATGPSEPAGGRGGDGASPAIAAARAMPSTPWR